MMPCRWNGAKTPWNQATAIASRGRKSAKTRNHKGSRFTTKVRLKLSCPERCNTSVKTDNPALIAPPPCCRDLFCAEAEVRPRGSLRFDRNRHGLLAHFFVDRRQSISPRRHSTDTKVAIGVSNGKKWSGRDVDKGIHPWVIVATDRNHDLRLIELLNLWRALRRLGDVDRGAAS